MSARSTRATRVAYRSNCVITAPYVTTLICVEIDSSRSTPHPHPLEKVVAGLRCAAEVADVSEQRVGGLFGGGGQRDSDASDECVDRVLNADLNGGGEAGGTGALQRLQRRERRLRRHPVGAAALQAVRSQLEWRLAAPAECRCVWSCGSIRSKGTATAAQSIRTYQRRRMAMMRSYSSGSAAAHRLRLLASGGLYERLPIARHFARRLQLPSRPQRRRDSLWSGPPPSVRAIGRSPAVFSTSTRAAFRSVTPQLPAGPQPLRPLQPKFS
jgi:hypothetical protein